MPDVSPLWYLNGESAWATNNYKVYSDWNKLAPTKTIVNNAVKLSMNNGSKYSGGYNSPAIDVTNLNSIKIHTVSGNVPTNLATSFVLAMITTTLQDSYTSEATTNILVTQTGPYDATNQTFTFDVSALSGNKYINFYIGSTNNCSVEVAIDRVWGE